MRAQDIMSENPACCRPDTPLPDVAGLMCDNDCGIIPVVDGDGKVLGVVTDRDIVCRGIAQGRDALQTRAEECMSHAPVVVRPDTPLEQCCELLERNQIRRLIVIDDDGVCCGVISQADVARSSSERQAGEVVREVSKETRRASVRPLPLMRV